MLLSSKSVIMDKREPRSSLILSFLIPGLGQLYNGKKKKATKLFYGVIISVFLALFFIGIITYLVIWIYAMCDGYMTADRINKGLIIA